MRPSQPGQAQAPPARPSDLFMDVAFFPPEAPKHRVEAGPSVLPATEETHPLHGYLERFPLRILAPGIGCPNPPHLGPPDGVKVRGDRLEIVVDNGSLQQIWALRMLPVVLLQPPYRTWGQQHVRVATEDRFSVRLTEHPILRRCCTPHLCGEYIPSPVHPTFHQLLGCWAAEVIHYQQFGVPQVLIQAEGLQGEIDAVKIVIGRYPDGQRDHAINPLPGSQNHPEYSRSLTKCIVQLTSLTNPMQSISQRAVDHRTVAAVAQESSGVLRRQPGELPLVFVHAHNPAPAVSKAGRRNQPHVPATHDTYPETLAYHDLSTTYARGVKLFLALLEGCAYRKPFSLLSDPLATKLTFYRF